MSETISVLALVTKHRANCIIYILKTLVAYNPNESFQLKQHHDKKFCLGNRQKRIAHIRTPRIICSLAFIDMA